MCNLNRFSLIILSLIIFVSCNDEDLAGNIIRAENIEEANKLATRAYDLGPSGIPIFLEVLDKSIEKKFNVLAYGKVNLSINYLHKLAMEDIYSRDEVPVLIETIKYQVSIADTLKTAQTLTLITGIDVGYTKEFVSNYTEADEEIRMKMIERWQKWYVTQNGIRKIK